MNEGTIVHIASYYPPHLGGLERVVQEVAEEQVRKGRSVTVLTSSIGARNIHAEDVSCLTVKRLWAVEFAHTPLMPTLLWHLLRVSKPMVFHLHLSQAFAPEMVWLASKIRKVPYVVHFHLDVEPSGVFGFIFVWWKKWIQARILKDAAHVITLSEDQKTLIEERYGRSSKDVTFIGNGVSSAFLKIGEKERVFHTPLRLLFVGRLASQKRVERIIEALDLLRIPVELTIVGDGEERERLEMCAQKGKNLNIAFRGSLQGEALLGVYRDADVFVLPSDREGMPLVLLEAMAAGLPVIGSDVLGIRELLQGVGVLVPNPSPHTFAHAFTALYETPTRLPELRVASIEKAREYSWEKSVSKIERVYKELTK